MASDSWWAAWDSAQGEDDFSGLERMSLLSAPEVTDADREAAWAGLAELEQRKTARAEVAQRQSTEVERRATRRWYTIARGDDGFWYARCSLCGGSKRRSTRRFETNKECHRYLQSHVATEEHRRNASPEAIAKRYEEEDLYRRIFGSV